MSSIGPSTKDHDLVKRLEEAAATVGRIHSVETCGTVDGPGVRFIVFFQGCGLKCVYCHNADTRDTHGGRQVTAGELFGEIKKYVPFMRSSHGGVTFSGGEPLLQPTFLHALLDLCHEEQIETAIDTSGAVDLRVSREALDRTDLVLLDIKSFDPEIYHHVTGGHVSSTLHTAEYLDQIGKRTWIRFVLVPGWTDQEDNVRGLARYVAKLSNVERTQILPFHKMGEYKWNELGLPYALRDAKVPTAEEVECVRRIFLEEGVKAEV
jgi:pyruvate formate lyase activating enzyme